MPRQITISEDLARGILRGFQQLHERDYWRKRQLAEVRKALDMPYPEEESKAHAEMNMAWLDELRRMVGE